MNPIAPLYVGRKQAATMLSCSVQTVASLIRKGKLQACYVGRAVRIKVSDLEAALPTYNPAAPLGRRNKQAAAKRRVN